jgi:hypothetical protein
VHFELKTEAERVPDLLHVRYLQHITFSTFCASNGSHSNRVTVTRDRARVVRRDGVHLGLPGQHAGPDSDDQGR